MELPEDLAAELAQIQGDRDEIYDRFCKDIAFGTSGLRGKMGAGTNRINSVVLRKATMGIARYLTERYERPKLVIGFDKETGEGFSGDNTGRIRAGHWRSTPWGIGHNIAAGIRTLMHCRIHKIIDTINLGIKFLLRVSEQQIDFGNHHRNGINIHSEQLPGRYSRGRKQKGAAAAAGIEKGLPMGKIQIGCQLAGNFPGGIIGAHAVFPAFLLQTLVYKTQQIPFIRGNIPAG